MACGPVPLMYSLKMSRTTVAWTSWTSRRCCRKPMAIFFDWVLEPASNTGVSLPGSEDGYDGNQSVHGGGRRSIRSSCVSGRSGWCSRSVQEPGGGRAGRDRADHQATRDGTESLNFWVKQAEIDEGHKPGISTADAQRIFELERENRELRRANEPILTAASISSRPSSTVDRRSSRVHRRPPDPRVPRWAEDAGRRCSCSPCQVIGSSFSRMR